MLTNSSDKNRRVYKDPPDKNPPDKNQRVYKAGNNGIIIMELLHDSITNELRDDVVDSNFAKFRTDKVKVISIINLETKESMNRDSSIHDPSFVYEVGKIISTEYDSNINAVCTRGIHYFKTYEAALSWYYTYVSKAITTGIYRKYRENGQKHRETEYVNGYKHGFDIIYNEYGQRYTEFKYVNGHRYYGHHKKMSESSTRNDYFL